MLHTDEYKMTCKMAAVSFSCLGHCPRRSHFFFCFTFLSSLFSLLSHSHLAPVSPSHNRLPLPLPLPHPTSSGQPNSSSDSSVSSPTLTTPSMGDFRKSLQCLPSCFSLAFLVLDSFTLLFSTSVFSSSYFSWVFFYVQFLFSIFSHF